MSASSELRPEDCYCFVVRSAARSRDAAVRPVSWAPARLHVTQFSILGQAQTTARPDDDQRARQGNGDGTAPRLGRNVPAARARTV